ncbi:hypothetical protein, partial [Mitsuaria sp. TWR114]|uniref:hypothetical protein n=1 Tax=Mitsuaria sp. TWR114 TaxID=2601731 RepID=UPI001C9A45EF
QLATLGALWAYAEPLGTRAGFSPTAVQTLIAAGLACRCWAAASAPGWSGAHRSGRSCSAAAWCWG